jgi:threonine dehydratase
MKPSFLGTVMADLGLPDSAQLTTLAVTPADVAAAATRVAPFVHVTPLLSSRALSAACGCDLRLKAEHLQRSGSFKIRGALNRLLNLSDAEKRAGVVAFSSGNHAQGVALAAQLLGISATIVMPQDAPQVKLQATRGYGAEIVLYDRHREDREAIARRLSVEQGRVLVPPFDDPWVIAGQGTVGHELIAQWPELEVALVPVGGGGLISGIALALKAFRPTIRIIGVEPEVADDARQSLKRGQIVRIPQPRTLADGVATQAIGQHTFPIMRALLDDIVTVSEAEIQHALELIWTRTKQLVEPTGALTTAAALGGQLALSGRRVMALLCGGNVDVRSLSQILATSPGA